MERGQAVPRRSKRPAAPARRSAVRRFLVLNPYGVPDGHCVFQNEALGRFIEGEEFAWPDPKTGTAEISQAFIDASLHDGVIQEVTE